MEEKVSCFADDGLACVRSLDNSIPHNFFFFCTVAGGALKLLSTGVNQLCVKSNTQQAANECRSGVDADNRLMICCRELFKTFQMRLSYSFWFQLRGL